MKTLTFLGALIISAALQPAFAQAPAQQVEPQPGTIDVIGEASVNLAPDYATINIVVEKQHLKPAEAQKATMEEMSAVLSYLKSVKNISEVKTQVVELRPVYRDYQKGEKEYMARQIVSFRLNDLEQYDDVILELLQKGIDGIGQVAFRSTAEEKYEETLLKQAVIDAREKATLLAAELGQSIGKATFITDRSYNSPYPHPEGARMLKMDSGPSVEPGELTLSMSVNIRFQLH